jgi:C4-dicarboxylate transporter
MWPWDDQMQTFKALSYGDKLRVSRCLVRGVAPNDPRMAAAAIELAESYERQTPAYTALMRWFPLIVVVGNGYLALPDVMDGDQAMAIFYALVVLLSVEYLMFSPAMRPKNRARSLEASRRLSRD